MDRTLGFLEPQPPALHRAVHELQLSVVRLLHETPTRDSLVPERVPTCKTRSIASPATEFLIAYRPNHDIADPHLDWLDANPHLSTSSGISRRWCSTNTA